MKYCAYHTHSTFSDGKNTMEEMVQAAIEAGMPCLGLSDHSDSPYQEYCMRKEQYSQYLAEIERLQKKYAGQITLLKGIELDSNSDPAITEPIEAMCLRLHIPCAWVPSMMDLGKACGIEVGAAAAAAVR